MMTITATIPPPMYMAPPVPLRGRPSAPRRGGRRTRGARAVRGLNVWGGGRRELGGWLPLLTPPLGKAEIGHVLEQIPAVTPEMLQRERITAAQGGSASPAPRRPGAGKDRGRAPPPTPTRPA